MSYQTITVAAIAALGLSLGAYSASAGPLNQGCCFAVSCEVAEHFHAC